MIFQVNMMLKSFSEKANKLKRTMKILKTLKEK